MSRRRQIPWVQLIQTLGAAAGVVDQVLTVQSMGNLPPMQSPRERGDGLKEAVVLAIRTEPEDPEDP